MNKLTWFFIFALLDAFAVFKMIMITRHYLAVRKEEKALKKEGLFPVLSRYEHQKKHFFHGGDYERLKKAISDHDFDTAWTYANSMHFGETNGILLFWLIGIPLYSYLTYVYFKDVIDELIRMIV